MSGCYTMCIYALLAFIIHLLKLVIMKINEPDYFFQMRKQFIELVPLSVFKDNTGHKHRLIRFLYTYNRMLFMYELKSKLVDKKFLSLVFEAHNDFVYSIFFSDTIYSNDVLYACHEFISAFNDLLIVYSDMLRMDKIVG